MEEKIKNSIIIIDYIVLIVAMIVSSITTPSSNITLVILAWYVVLLYSFTYRYYITIRNRILKNVDVYQAQTMVIRLFEVFSLICIAAMDSSYSYIVVFAVILENMMLDSNSKVSFISLILITLVVLTIIHVKANGDYSQSLKVMIVVVLFYLLIYFIFYLVTYLIKQNRIIENSLNEITIKKLEKDNLYDNLKEAYEKIESITTLKERNRIAAEIHDTVGHTLTTVLVELEASKRLIIKDNKDKALEKLKLAQGQVREGLNSIRSSVRVLADGKDILNFYNSLKAVINQCEINSDVIIEREINENLIIQISYMDIIMSALMEGLSNGLRHSKCTYFKFKLIEEDNKILFELKNYGLVKGVIILGFGLKSMKIRVEELDGEFYISAKEGEGFTLSFKLPMNFKEQDYE